MNTFVKKLAAAVTAVAALGAVFIAPFTSAQYYGAPAIYDFTTSHSAITTGYSEVNVDFKVSETAYTNVRIEQNGQFIADLPLYGSSSGVWLNPDVNYSTQWDGRDQNGYEVSAGYYDIAIFAENESGSDADSRSVYVDNNVVDPTPPTNSSVELSDVYVSPTTFDPAEEDTTLFYTINTPADIRVEVIADNSFESRAYTIFDGYQTTGSHHVDWDGRFYDGRIRPEGDYRFRITADNGYDTDTEIRTTYIDYEGSINDDDYEPRPRISNVDVTPERFNPYNEDTEIEFFLDRPADVIFEIRTSYSDRPLQTLLDRRLDRGTHVVRWNGRDADGRIVPKDEYRYIIIAQNPIGQDIQNGRFTVDHDEDIDFRPRRDNRYFDEDYYNPRYDLPRYYDYDFDPIIRPIPRPVRDGYECAGFADVREGNELCDAVRFVKDMGIFNGYADGLFRPDQPINRAEVTKVILKGFNIRVVPASGTRLNFTDVDANAWYMPFVRTAKRLGIVQGYPNGEFAPNQTMNRAELLKVFMMTSGRPVPSCVNSPYADTPNEPKTHWYIDFVCFSKQHRLMDDTINGRFDPAMPITRGDVAKLFYRFHQKGFLADSLQYNG